MLEKREELVEARDERLMRELGRFEESAKKDEYEWGALSYEDVRNLLYRIAGLPVPAEKENSADETNL